MNENKLKTITNLFEGNEIRSIWDGEKEDYYFSVVDVIKALTDSSNPRDYWYRLKTRMSEEEKSEVSTKCRQFKLKAKAGGDVAKVARKNLENKLGDSVVNNGNNLSYAYKKELKDK